MTVDADLITVVDCETWTLVYAIGGYDCCGYVGGVAGCGVVAEPETMTGETATGDDWELVGWTDCD